ncbi:MAG: hypothetical protein WD757_04330 [Actinomycetota bacterium]
MEIDPVEERWRRWVYFIEGFLFGACIFGLAAHTLTRDGWSLWGLDIAVSIFLGGVAALALGAMVESIFDNWVLRRRHKLRSGEGRHGGTAD